MLCREELGISATPEQLHFAGTFPISFAKEFHGKMFRDEEIAFVYIYQEPVNTAELVLQTEEVEEVQWFDLEEVYEQCGRVSSVVKNKKFASGTVTGSDARKKSFGNNESEGKH